MKLAGVVVFYNPTRDNIKIIDNYIDSLDVLYIIDNSNISNEKVIPKNKKIKYYPNNSNKGIAYALNKACNIALSEGYNFILTLDQDSFIDNKIINDMKDYIIKNDVEDIGIISPYHDIISLNDKPKKKLEYVMEVMTSGNIVNLEIFKKIGGFKSWLFIDDVDIEYCLNLNKNGYKVLRLNYLKMKHNLGNSKIIKIFNKKIVCSNHSAIRRYYMIRNMFYINDLYKETYPEYCNFLKNVQKGQVKYVIFFEKDKLKKLIYMYRGYVDYKNNVKGSYKER
jgi:rhamnosyltransferase